MKRYSRAAEFDNGPFNYAYEVPIHQVQESLRRTKERNVALLEQAIESLKDRLAEHEDDPADPPYAIASDRTSHASVSSPSKKVFVVHGHGGIEHAIAGFLRKLGLVPVILHEQPSEGRTIIEKFEAHSDVGFAVVLLTPDDVGGLKDGPQRPRARQNVVLELGYFVGRFGRSKVCPLMQGDIELPSDVLGVAWVALDAHGGWHVKLAKELQAAGYEFDFNKVLA
jgi:predicted nucleotide-binding protein